jgi:2-keto-3-deoxygluconate permease
VVLGVGVVVLTGGLTYLGYRFILRRGPKSGIGFAAGTTAGNAVAVPAAVAVADPKFEPFVASAAAQTATAVLVTALLAPSVAAWVMRRAGGIKEDEQDLSHITTAS